MIRWGILCLPTWLFMAGCSTHEAAPTNEIRVPLVESSGLPVVALHHPRVSRPLFFAIDTGSRNVITTKLARELGSNAGGQARPTEYLVDVNGIRIPAVRQPFSGFRLEDLELGPLWAFVADSPALTTFCPPLDGVLGVARTDDEPNLLESFAISLLFDQGEVVFRSAFAAPDADLGTAIPVHRQALRRTTGWSDSREVFLPVEIDGETIPAVIDTGSNNFADMSLELFVAIGGDIAGKGVKRYVGKSHIAASGVELESQEQWTTMIDRARIGGVVLTGLPIDIEPHTQSQDVDFRLGMRSFQGFDLTLDLPNHRIWLRDRGLEAPSGIPLALGWDFRDGVAEIVGVLQDGAADQAGLRIGDELVEWDGIAIGHGDYGGGCRARIRRLSSEDPTVTLKIRREGRIEQFTLPRFEPFP